MSDTIFLRGLAIDCTIGFLEWERKVKQTVVLDLEVPVDCARAAEADDVTQTVDYKAMAKRVEALSKELTKQAKSREAEREKEPELVGTRSGRK